MGKSTIKVLLIEDDEDDYVLTKDLLSGISGTEFLIDWISTPEEALAEFKEARHDVFLLDYRLGETTGVELLKSARESGCNIPIVMLTGQEYHEIDEETIRSGAMDYLMKQEINATLLERSIRYAIAWGETRNALRESEQRFRILAEHTTDLISRLSPDGKFRYVSPSSISILGYEPEEMVDHGFIEFCHKKDERIMNLFFQGPLDHPKTLEHRVSHRDGQSLWLETSFKPIKNPKKIEIKEILATSRDITERKKQHTALSQSQKMDAVEVLSAGIAHEINTPLQFVRDNTRFLSDSVSSVLSLIESMKDIANDEPNNFSFDHSEFEFVTEQIPLALKETLEGIDHIVGITTAMKEFSQASSVNREMEVSDINETLKRAAALSSSETTRIAEIQWDLDEKLPPVQCYPDELAQVFINFLVNAAHAIDDKKNNGDREKGEIRIATECKDNDIVVSIADDGIGIPESVQSRIFDPFYTTRDVGKGTGIGLMLAHEVVVKKHKGSINLNSEVGTGSEFCLHIPMSL